MQQQPGSRLDSAPLQSLKWIRDLVYYEGPLVAEARNEHNEPFIFSWCDSDESVNRWLVARVKERDLIKLTMRNESLGKMLRDPLDPWLYLVDIDERLVHVKTSIVPVRDVPDDYLPALNSPLPGSGAMTAKGSYAVLLDGNWATDELLEFPKAFQKAYLAMYSYGTHHKHAGAAASAPNHPWRGGFSTVAFFNNLKTQTPTHLQPRVEAFAYASPGYVRWSLDGATASAVSRAVEQMKPGIAHTRAIVRAAQTFVRDAKLNDGSAQTLGPASIEWETLEELFGELASRMPFIDAGHMRTVHGDHPFVLLKISLAIFKRLDFLCDLEERKLLEL